LHKFWNFTNVADSNVVELRIEGDIVDDGSAWFYDWLDIPHTNPNKFRDQLKEHEGKELHVIIDTYGGSVFAGASIYADLKARKGKTVGIVHAKCMSIGTVILMGCDEIKLSPTAILMIHDPMAGLHGSIEEFEKMLEVLNKIKESIINAYVSKTNQDRETLANMMRNETWMTAHEAVEEGFADGVIEDDQGITNGFSYNRVAITNSINLSIDQVKKYIDLKNEQAQEEAKAKRLRELELGLYA